MDEVLKELIIQASHGKVMIGDESYNIAFTTDIYGSHGLEYTTGNSDIFPKLFINNYPLFKDKLFECIELQKERVSYYFANPKDELKYLVAFTFINATYYDFTNPVGYLERLISILKDDTFDKIDEVVTVPNSPLFFKSVRIKNKKQSIQMETPNKMTFTLEETIDGKPYSFTLPEISYGISMENGEPVCYIYSILNRERKEVKDQSKLKYRKRVARSLYKLDAGVPDDESLNLLDVPAASVLSLSMFLALLERNNIKKIKTVIYTPERYLSRYIAAKEDPLYTAEWNQRNDTIQTNATNKFITAFFRMMYHLDNLHLEANKIDVDDIIRLELDESTKIKPDIVNAYYQATKTNSVELQQRL